MDNLILTTLSEDQLKDLISDTIEKALRKVTSESDPLASYPETLTRSEVSDILGIALGTVDSWSRGPNPKLIKIYIGNAARFRKSDIQKILSTRA